MQELDLPPQQVIGLGTVLDTTRLRSLLAQRLDVPPSQVQVTIYGEHGDSMVPIWSQAQVAGLPLDKYPGVNSDADRRSRKEDPRLGGRGDQEERGRWVRGRGRRSPTSFTASPSTSAAFCRSRRCRTAPTAFTTSASACPTIVGRQGCAAAHRSRPVAEGTDRPAEVRRRCCGRRSTRC